MFVSLAIAQKGPYERAKIVSMPEYQLPDDYRSAGIDGELNLMVEVDRSGTVKKAEVWSGPIWPCGTKLDSEVEKVRRGVRDTMMRAKFSPASRGGEPQSDKVLMNFRIGTTDERAKGGASATPPKSIEGGNLNGKALSLPRPEYPSGARGVSLISIKVFIDEQGKVAAAGSTSGGNELLFADAARSAACKARFAPTTLAGNPVRVTGVLTYNFGLTAR